MMRCNLCGKLAMIIREEGSRTICGDHLLEKLVEQGGREKREGRVQVIGKNGPGSGSGAGGLLLVGDAPFHRWIEGIEGKKTPGHWAVYS